MIFPRDRLIITALIAGGLFLFPQAGFGQAQSDSALLASYDVHWKGLKIMTIESRTEMSAARYSQVMTLRTRGLLKLFVDGRTVASSEGRRGKNDALIPERYESEGQWEEDYYMRRVSYDSEGKPSKIVIDAPEDGHGRDPVPDQLQNALDPLSLVLYAIGDPWNLISGTLTEASAIPGAGAMASFDGIQSMAYELTCDSSPKTVKKRRRTIYEGPAYLCELSGYQTGGFLQEEDDDRNVGDEEEEVEIEKLQMWVVPAPEAGFFIPVIIEMSSGRGKVKIFLKEINMDLILDAEGPTVRLSP